ncbi:MAG: dienelactone hydrolase family protein [Nitrosomonas sp.]|nr:MAG: dienelactone hydrolase family protein [Nitrosomonas sp.]
MTAVSIPVGVVELDGELVLPLFAAGIVLFAHGSGSSRFSPRNIYVVRVLQQHGIATLLFDLLTHAEDRNEGTRFDIDLLVQRLLAATVWLQDNPETKRLRIGYFGGSTGAAAALQAAAAIGSAVSAVVLRGGRPDLVGSKALSAVITPTLLIVGGCDYSVMELDQTAYAMMTCERELMIVPGATHLFTEPGALEQAAGYAADWFLKYLQ